MMGSGRGSIPGRFCCGMWTEVVMVGFGCVGVRGKTVRFLLHQEDTLSGLATYFALESGATVEMG